MTSAWAFRLIVFLAALMGACGVALAALAAHQGDSARFVPASAMLLVHAVAALGAVLLAGVGIARRGLGLTAAWGFVIGATLFAGDLALRHYVGTRFFPMATPTGGTLMILSWVMLALAAAAPRRAR